jgi:hypothetical protein
MAYTAVGMQSALDSAIGLPSRSTKALWMLVFLMPAEVSRNFTMLSLADWEPNGSSSLSYNDAVVIQHAAPFKRREASA